ncbi:MAG: hypothetical protein JWP89_2710 [Schlesneria sp.]|nr:hypothetical protein [Schlesneria sp.]
MAQIHLDENDMQQLTERVIRAIQPVLNDLIKASALRPIAIAKVDPTPISPADTSWGYVFGVDGLMTVDAAGEFLSVSGRTLDRLSVQGKIRKGRFPSNVRAFCKRSVFEFAQSLEE